MSRKIRKSKEIIQQAFESYGKKFAQENSWQKKVEELWEVVFGTFNQR